MKESVNQNKERMLEYEIVRLPYKYSFWTGQYSPEKEPLLVIEEYVNNGWELLQLFQSNTKGLYGSPEFLEIIFTRPISDTNPPKRRVRYEL